VNVMQQTSLLDVQDLSGAYFAPVSFKLAAGEVLCLFGVSGSGKSQFLRALVS